MNRVIKFRGKSKYSDIWVYGYLFEDITPARHQCYILEGGFVPAISMPAEKFKEIKKETRGQFTGCLDNTKKEIYSGDIIEMCFGYDVNPKVFVVYVEEEAAFKLKWNDGNYSILSNSSLHKVIGNVWEDYSLLKY